MELRQLEIFVTVADTGSFSQAAEQLFITQPTVSAHIRRLEEELGTVLFDRNTRRLTVSETGKRLYPYAVSMLDLRAKAKRELQELSGGRQIIHIGASTVPSAHILPKAVAGYGRDHPEISFEIWRSDSLGVVEEIVRGGLDIGLVGMRVETPGCLWQPLAWDELVLVTPANAHFNELRARNAGLPELMREPVLIREPSSGTRRETERLLSQAGIEPSSLLAAASFNDPEAIRNSIVLGMGVSVMSRWSAEDLAEAGKVLIFPLKGIDARRQLYVVRREDLFMLPYIQDFIAYLLRDR